jgi:endonuclease III related protein
MPQNEFGLKPLRDGFFKLNHYRQIIAYDPPLILRSAVSSRRTSYSAYRLRRMHDALLRAYGPQHWWPAQTPFEVILGAYLTQNTAWKAVERSLANLRVAGALTIDGLRKLPLAKLRRLIQPSGFYTRKAPALKAFVALLDKEFSGSLERLAATPTAPLRKRLLDLPGVGPETADAILLYALGHPVPVADEYLRRIAARHGLLAPEPGRARISYDDLTELTRRAFAGDPPENHAQLYNEFHALTVAVGKAHCGRTARCENCPLAGDLKAAGSRQQTAQIRN